MPETNREDTRRIIENRRRKAELMKAKQVKRRNRTIAIIAVGAVMLIMIVLLIKACSPNDEGNNREQNTTVTSTTATVETTILETTKAEEYMYTTEILNLRKSPSVKADIITQIGAGKKVQIIFEDGKWCKIKYGKDTGYVSREYLSYSNMLD